MNDIKGLLVIIFQKLYELPIELLSMWNQSIRQSPVFARLMELVQKMYNAHVSCDNTLFDEWANQNSTRLTDRTRVFPSAATVAADISSGQHIRVRAGSHFETAVNGIGFLMIPRFVGMEILLSGDDNFFLTLQKSLAKRLWWRPMV